MSEINIKHQKHRTHPVLKERKLELLKQLLQTNKDKNIIVVSSTKNDELNSIDLENVTIIDDKTLYNDKELKTNLIISYDVPKVALVYISRLSHSDDGALILLQEDEQNLIYPIETLLGRAIKQEVIAGFEVEVAVVEKTREFKSSYNDKKSFSPRGDKKPYGDKKTYGKKKEFSKDDKKPYDKKKTSPKKIGRTITIKSLKKKDS